MGASSMPRMIVALLAGMLFGVGLAVSGMVNPAKIIGFLDVAGGEWDPTLIFVMGGALLVTIPAFRMILKRPRPILATGLRCRPSAPWTGARSEAPRCLVPVGG
jgi:uncharacterized protein